MLDVRGHAHPGVLAIFVDRDRRCWKIRLCECADRNGCETLIAFGGVVDRGAANRTEAERSLAAFVAHAQILVRLTSELDALCSKARLCTKDAASSPLACQTVADPDANRIFARCCAELATAARGDSCTHAFHLPANDPDSVACDAQRTHAPTLPHPLSRAARCRHNAFHWQTLLRSSLRARPVSRAW